MDLRTVREELIGGNYQSKSDFLKDVRMIFTNSRHYNTNPRSRVSLSISPFYCIYLEKKKKDIHIFTNGFNAKLTFHFIHLLFSFMLCLFHSYSKTKKNRSCSKYFEHKCTNIKIFLQLFPSHRNSNTKIYHKMSLNNQRKTRW